MAYRAFSTTEGPHMDIESEIHVKNIMDREDELVAALEKLTDDITVAQFGPGEYKAWLHTIPADRPKNPASYAADEVDDHMRHLRTQGHVFDYTAKITNIHG